MKKYLEKHIGKSFTTTEGYKATVVGGGSKPNYCKIELDGAVFEYHFCQLAKGIVKNRNHKSIYGVGYVGFGQHKTKISGVRTLAYSKWFGMMTRCYDSKYHDKKPTYRDCSVCEQWHNFQNFADWFYMNYPGGDEIYHLDKDKLINGNRVYSPLACSFISAQENSEVSLSKSFSFISPNGCLINLYNLQKFCRDNNLQVSHMHSVSTGKRKTHKGWTKAK